MNKNRRTARLIEMVVSVEADPANAAVLTEHERIAVAIVLRRLNLLTACGVLTLDEARERLGKKWWKTCLALRASADARTDDLAGR
jgi:hypothetical protein